MKEFWSLKYAGTISMIVGLAGIAVAGCGPQMSRQTSVPVGTQVNLLPLADSTKEREHSSSKRKNVLISFSVGGHFLNSSADGVIEIFGRGNSSQPIYSFPVADLTMMHKKTGCSTSEAALLNPVSQGEALFCKGSFDLEQAALFVLKTGESRKLATSYILNFTEDSAVGIGVSFF